MRSKRCICCAHQFNSKDTELNLNDKYKIVFCSNCQIGFTCLSSSQEIERNAINKSLYNLRGRLETYFGRMIEFNRRYEQCLSLICKHTEILSALDIGCNIGYLLYFLKKNGISDSAGVETNDECRAAGQSIFNLEIYKELSSIHKTFDLILFCDVLEHLDDPIQFLEQTFPLSHSATIYFIQLPNYQSSMAEWLGTKWPEQFLR